MVGPSNFKKRIRGNALACRKVNSTKVTFSSSKVCELLQLVHLAPFFSYLTKNAFSNMNSRKAALCDVTAVGWVVGQCVVNFQTGGTSASVLKSRIGL